MIELRRRFWVLFEQHYKDFYAERRECAARWMELARARMEAAGDEELAAVDAALELVKQGVEVVDIQS